MPLNTPTTIKALELALQGLLEFAGDDDLAEHMGETLKTDNPPRLERTQTFDEAGVLTRDKGLVLTMSDGTEFQLTIVQSR